MKEHFVVLVTTAPALQPATLELATRLASRSNAVLLFLHIVPLRANDSVGMLYAAIELAREELQDWLHAQGPTDPSLRYRHRLEAGPPEDIVTRFVAEHDVELVVAESPPRGRIAHALSRGLGERLVRLVDCPVVIGGPEFLSAASAPASPRRFPRADTNIAELLNAMVEARVDALRCWMDHAGDAVQRMAHSDTLRYATDEAQRTAELERGTLQRIYVELEEHRRALRAVGWQLSLGRELWGGDHAVPPDSPALRSFVASVRERGFTTSLPLPVDGDPDRLAVLAGARLPGSDAVLVFSFDAESEFLRILGQPGPLPTFETYAFDKDGLMLSNSQFPEHLWAAGLLPADDAQTPLRVRVAEPSEGPCEEWPLTHMVQQAVRNRDGFDTRGYLDYRGMTVVGAWRWLPDYGFGVAAEVDRAAAFQ